MKFLIINGVNLCMTGKREPDVYGSRTLTQINLDLTAYAKSKGVELEFFCSNFEGEIVEKIHKCDLDGIIINAGAHTHYSYAIADALKCISMPKIEVHMSNVHKREEFRRHSVLSPVCDGVICGFNENSYRLAIDAAIGLTVKK